MKLWSKVREGMGQRHWTSRDKASFLSVLGLNMQPGCCSCEKCHFCKHRTCPSSLSWWIHLCLPHCHIPVGSRHTQHDPLISPAPVPVMRLFLGYCQPLTFLFTFHHPSSHVIPSSLKLLNLSQHFLYMPRARASSWQEPTLCVRSRLPWFPQSLFSLLV